MRRFNKGEISKISHLLFAHFPGHVYWLDEKKRYLGCNQLYCDFLGIKNEQEMIGKASQDILASLDIQVETAHLFNGYFEKTYIFAHKSSFKFKVTEVISGNIFLFFEEELSHYLKYIDQLEKKCSSLETKKNKTEVYLNNLIQIVPASVYWKNVDSVIIGSNLTHARLAGFSKPEEVIGKTEYDFVWKDQAASIIENDRLIMRSGEGLKLEETATLQDGAVHTFLTSKEPLRDKDNNIIGIIGISLDITDRKKMEKELHQAKLAAEAASQAKSEFIANMSHDIRTPLTGVVGMAKLIEDSVVNENIKHYAQLLEESGNQLFNMLNNILEMISQGRENGAQNDDACFDLRKMIENVIELERPSAVLKNIDLTTTVSEAIPSYLVGKCTKLQQIILNLIGNAIKFTNKGYVKLVVDCLKKSQDSVLLRFYVIDTGIGISPEFQDKVFEQFTRGTPSYKGLYAGYGLGLHIAQTYAHDLGSHIEFTSEVDKGTTFSFDMPLKIAEAPEDMRESIVIPTHSVKRQTHASKTIKQLEKKVSPDAPHILVVEDNKIALLSLENLIIQAGCRFTSAMDGERALDFATTQSFDLIITDIGLPGISGLDLSEKIREWEKKNNIRHVPIVALTGHAKNELESMGSLSVINKALTKPMRLETLKAIIDEFISSMPNPKKIYKEEYSLPNYLELKLPKMKTQLFELDPYPLFDLEAGLNADDGKQELLENKLNDLLLLLSNEESITSAIAVANWPALENLIVKIKNHAIYCGATKLLYACFYVEQYCKDNYSDLCERLCVQLLQIMRETKQSILNWFEQENKFFMSSPKSPCVQNGLGRDLPSKEEQLFELDQYPLLDVAKGIEILGSEESLLEMLKLLLIQTPKDKVEIEQAYAAGDWERIEELAHRTKSGASYSGTVRMKYACQYLERYRKAGHSRLLEQLYQQLLSVLEETMQAINQWLDKQ